MKRPKKVLWIILSVIVLFFLFSIWYKYEYSMEVVEAYEVNTPDFDRKLLIATQGSTFKDSITNKLVNHYKSDSIFIKVIDVSSLVDIKPDEYTGIVIMHTWENWKPPFVVREFIEQTIDQRDKIVVLTTSGEGTYKMAEVDAITGESNLEEISNYAKKMITRTELILKSKD
ncbi:hypothetical protein [Aquimarina celericrescens]|uniref:Flavodoxin-like domain-containing protein n=1 Tax=Aquimarina celericrescens TaxID=1964542 RepID=A0ABW5AWZ9_9FLAO|nr:hypothetical protein [Aquimarina celericrescens]